MQMNSTLPFDAQDVNDADENLCSVVHLVMQHNITVV